MRHVQNVIGSAIIAMPAVLAVRYDHARIVADIIRQIARAL